MDIAEIIYNKAIEMNKLDMERNTLKIFISFNIKNISSQNFIILPNNKIEYNNSIFTFTKENISNILIQFMKRYCDYNYTNIVQIHISVCNKYFELFYTRLPRKINPCIKIQHILEYDVNTNNKKINNIIEFIWKFLSKFKKD